MDRLNVYLAASFPRKSEVGELASRLQHHHNYRVVSTWTSQREGYDAYDKRTSDKQRKEIAVRDCRQIEAADVLVELTDEPDKSLSHGGRAAEVGYALAKGKHVIVVGHPEHVFHWHPHVVHVADEKELLVSLQMFRVLRGGDDG